MVQPGGGVGGLVQIQDSAGNNLTSTAGSLNVNVTAGGGGGTQYVDGVTNTTPTGTVALGKNNTNILHALSLDASGNLNVNLAAGTISGGNAAAGLTGAAVPASADYTGFNSGGNLVGVSAANPLPVAATLVDTSQGSVNGGAPGTTSGLSGGVYHAAGITLTDGQQASLQLDNDGDLQVGYENSEQASYVNATWTNATAGNTTLVSSSVGFGNTTFGVVCTGTISIGVLQFECSMDGTTWQPIGVVPVAGNPTSVTSLSIAGSGVTQFYQMFTGGMYQVRIRLSTSITGAGTCKVMLRPSVIATEFAQTVYQPTGSNLHVLVDSPLPALVAGNQIVGQVKVVDGAGSVNQLAVTNASTAAQATDKAVVVGLSPNSPLPAGTNVIGTVTSNQATPTYWSSTAGLGPSTTISSTVFDTSIGGAWISYSAYSVTGLNVYFDESVDGVNWPPIGSDAYIVAAGGSNYSFHHPSTRYCRVRFVNSGVDNPGGVANIQLAANQTVFANETDVSIVDTTGNPMGVNGKLTAILSDGTYNVNVGAQNALQVDGPSFGALLQGNIEILRQLKKLVFIQTQISGFDIDDDDIDI
jgi:hypothetical protein